MQRERYLPPADLSAADFREPKHDLTDRFIVVEFHVRGDDETPTHHLHKLRINRQLIRSEVARSIENVQVGIEQLNVERRPWWRIQDRRRAVNREPIDFAFEQRDLVDDGVRTLPKRVVDARGDTIVRESLDGNADDNQRNRHRYRVPEGHFEANASTNHDAALKVYPTPRTVCRSFPS